MHLIHKTKLLRFPKLCNIIVVVATVAFATKEDFMILNDMSMIIRYNHIFMNRSLSHTDIASNEYYLLMYLFSSDEVTQDDISEYFGIDKGSISKTISSLEQKGYVQRQINQENRRSNIITITKKGRSTFSETKKILDQWHQSILHNITKDQLETMGDALEKMACNAKRALESEHDE